MKNKEIFAQIFFVRLKRSTFQNSTLSKLVTAKNFGKQ